MVALGLLTMSTNETDGIRLVLLSLLFVAVIFILMGAGIAFYTNKRQQK